MSGSARIKELLGRLTGDRAVEAKGRADRDRPSDAPEATEAEHAATEERVRAEHGDLGVDAVPKGTAQGG